jgi:hypothetical protein
VPPASLPTAAILPTPTASLPAAAIPPTSTPPPPASIPDLAPYAFPASIDKTRPYLFYLHGKAIEDQGLPAVSPDFGEYQYPEILEKLASSGFVVVSEMRAKDTEVHAYAQRVVEQVTLLLQAGVPPHNITVVGASKGAWIAVLVSHLLHNPYANFVLLAICSPEAVAAFKQEQVVLAGNVLSIYDDKDPYAGSCQELFDLSQGKGLAQSKEILLKLGASHGIVYQPLDAWVLPTIGWAEQFRR